MSTTCTLSYQPDSLHAHSEFMELYNRFVAHNRQNNCGDLSRLWSIILNVKQIIAEGVAGHFAELGIWRGNTAAVLAHFATLHARKAYFFDTLGENLLLMPDKSGSAFIRKSEEA